MRRLREAFVICPISKPRTVIRERSDALLELVVSPVLLGVYNCVVGRADHYADDPEFIEIINQRIARADLVVADLSGLNPNVMYELGHCHLLGIPVVLFIDDVDKMPSDIRTHKAIEYTRGDFDNDDRLRSIKAEFQHQVRGARGYMPRRPPLDMTARVVERFGLTTVEEVHNGRRDHYKMAQKVIADRPTRVVLLQRSSTILLGPEADWGDEASFYEALWDAVAHGTELYHVVTLEGITRHLARPQSEFPATGEALSRLTRVGGSVGVPIGHKEGEGMPVKRVPDESNDVDLKPDRQARALFADFGDRIEALFVMDFGGRQMSVRIRGPEADTMFHTALEFYSDCETLRWSDLQAAFEDAGHEFLGPPSA